MEITFDLIERALQQKRQATTRKKKRRGKVKRGEETQARKDRRPTRQGYIQTKGEPHHTGREGQQAKTHREKDRRMWRLTLIVMIIILDGFFFFNHHWAN